MTRLRLYLEDDRTVSVLVKHAQERIVDEYADFMVVVRSEYGEQLSGELATEEGLRALLQEVCGETSGVHETTAGDSGAT